MSSRPPATAAHDAGAHEQDHGGGHDNGHFTKPSAKAMAALALGALGVVYGDIGTSPLYAMRECFLHEAPTPGRVLGVVSLFFWSLTLVVVFKYLTFVLRAD